jgi:formylglycine-generating enzyme required for sulfatase activity/predicted Ser/Thr protein kinase
MVWNRGRGLFGNRYIIESKLGDGGFGITYLAKNRRGELRVIKTLREEILNDPAWIRHQGKLKQDFKDEALRLSFCRHPHIVEVENLFDDDDFPCMAMEYIEGEDLGKRITQTGALPEHEALLYIRQIGDALTLVHERGLLHRDLKPSNIMIRQGKQEAVLIDFGIARQFVSGSVQQHTESRTPGYAPPEQYLTNAERGEYIDVYALAATLYALVTGQLPMPAVERLQNKNLIPPQDFYRNISNRVNEAIMKGMALNYKFRPQSVEEWLDMLGAGILPPTQPVVNPVSQPKAPPSQPSQKSVNVSSPKQVVNNPVSQPQPKTPPQQKSGLSLKTFSFQTVIVDRRGDIINRPNLQAKYLVEDLGNGVTLEMVQIPGGTFTMGSPEGKITKKFLGLIANSEVGEEGRYENEGPQHTVNIQPFFMGKYVVTQAQYQAIMGNNPSHFKGEKRPVEQVSWDDAVEFCQKLSQKTGRTYRLPSEAEWEYACRAGTTTPFYFGETITTDLANYRGTDWDYNGTVYPGNYGNGPKGKYREKTTLVGKFPPNSFGLYDMHGNIWEWCEDNWHSNYNGAPTDGSAWVDNENNYRMLRGGSWYNNPDFCRSADRYNLTRDIRNFYYGFRVVLSLA